MWVPWSFLATFCVTFEPPFSFIVIVDLYGRSSFLLKNNNNRPAQEPRGGEALWPRSGYSGQPHQAFRPRKGYVVKHFVLQPP